MNRHLHALYAAAKKQVDPVKKQKILDKIKAIQAKQQWNKFLAR